MVNGISLRNADCFYRIAPAESAESNARHTRRDRDTCEIAAALKCIVPNTRYARRDCDVRKAAAYKRIFPYARQALRERDACKIYAVLKSAFFNTRHTLRDRDARKAAAVVKCISSDARRAVADLNCFDDFVPIRIPRCSVAGARGEIVHWARAGDSKRAVHRKRPCKVIAACARVNDRRPDIMYVSIQERVVIASGGNIRPMLFRAGVVYVG